MFTIVVQTRVTKLRGKPCSYLLIAVVALAAAIALPARAQTVLHVDGSADQTPHDGSDWCHAYLEVHEALPAAEPNTVIRVADGLYLPDPSGLEDPRDATFQLGGELTLEGGYAGCGADDPNERDITVYETVFSGDIGTPDDNADNCYHVVTVSGSYPTVVVLDGVTITAGNADGEYPRNTGGGIYNEASLRTRAANCTFRGNSGWFGAGMYSDYGGRAIVTDCVFTENTASYGGAGMYNDGGRAALTNCVFSGNSGGYGGGGFCNYSNYPTTLTNCSFSANSAAAGGGLLSDSSTRMTLANCTFNGNSATGTGEAINGGGMWSAGSPTLIDCTFTGNSAATSGGGMYNFDRSSPTLINCTFTGNQAAGANYGNGGGGMCGGDSPTLVDCTFVCNSGDYGGGIQVDGDAMLANCAFNGNSARQGGGMYADGDPTLINCTLVGNSAGYRGGAISGYDAHLTVVNCIVWSNVAPECPQLCYAGPDAVTYSCVQGGAPGEGNIDADPLFANPDNGDYRLTAGSPCIDAGNNTAVPLDILDLDDDGDTGEPLPYDLDGRPRFVDDPLTDDTGSGDPPIVDMGAYEHQVWHVDDDAPSDPGPGDPSVSDPLEDGSADHPFDAIQEGIDAAIAGDTVLVLDGTYTGDGNRDLDFGGKAIAVRSENGPENCIIDCEGEPNAPHRGFYFHSAEGPDSVVEGLTIMNGHASGSWPYNTGGGIQCEGSSPTISDCTMRGNSAIHGGGGVGCYYSSPTLADCTISGNSAHDGGGVYCFTSSPTLSNCVISGNYAADIAGGIWNDEGNPTLDGCTFTENSAGHAGGMYSSPDSSPTLINCTFSRNAVTFDGGGMHDGGSATLIDCTFSGNSAGYYGGGMLSSGATHQTLVDCVFSANTAGNGAGMCDRGAPGSRTLVNCTFSENSAVFKGGGMYIRGVSLTLASCRFSGNSANAGGGLYSVLTDPALTNCVISRNAAGEGGGIYCLGSDPMLANCTITWNSAELDGGGAYCEYSSPTLANCILWGDTPQEMYVGSGSPVVAYCDVEGGWFGTGNIDADPLFVDPDGPDNDPNTWEDNDYRLGSGSPCIDAGDNTAVPADFADLDGDGDTEERTPFDLDGNPRFVQDPFTDDTGAPDPPRYRYVVDMGAYEYQFCFGDLDEDDDIDTADLTRLLGSYGETAGMTYYDGDLDGDGDIDLADLAELLGHYGETCW